MLAEKCVDTLDLGQGGTFDDHQSRQANHLRHGHACRRRAHTRRACYPAGRLSSSVNLMTTRPPYSVILAGGAGRRMGGNKPFYPFEGVPMVEAVIASLEPQSAGIFINAGARQTELAARLESLGHPTCHDDPAFADLGPLSGVRTALKVAIDLGEIAIVTVPCDMPRLPRDLVERLVSAQESETDATHVRGQRDYPLCTLWKVRLLPHLEAALSAARSDGGLSVMRYLSTCRVNVLETDDDKSFVNINAPVNRAPEG